MTRLPSDHEAVTTHRTHVESVGRTSRPQVPVPETVEVAIGDVVRLTLADETRHARVRETLGGGRDLRGAYANARLARAGDAGEGDDHLREWVESAGLSTGDAVLFDTVTPGFQYGLRRPGERVVYTALDPPASSLSDIARDVDG